MIDRNRRHSFRMSDIDRAVDKTMGRGTDIKMEVKGAASSPEITSGNLGAEASQTQVQPEGSVTTGRGKPVIEVLYICKLCQTGRVKLNVPERGNQDDIVSWTNETAALCYHDHWAKHGN